MSEIRRIHGELRLLADKVDKILANEKKILDILNRPKAVLTFGKPQPKEQING